MEDPETSQITKEREEEANAFSLIDVSASDDDFLLASSSEASRVDNPGDVLTEGASINQRFDSMELPRPSKNGKCNLRKSLAWDSAFFTSAGVLDAEELSSIMEGAEAGVNQKHILPGIQEDLSKSTDSISTFESDLTLESIEADLFCDIRASIQRCSRTSTPRNCSSTKIHEEGESKGGRLTERVEPSSASKVKPKLASKKLHPGVQGPVKSLKAGSVCKQVPKPAVRSKESNSMLLRPPAVAPKPSLIGAATTKRMSVGAGHKLESNTSGNSKGVAGRGASFLKVSPQADSRNTAPKSMHASKISSGSSVLSRAAIGSSRSSCDSSGSSSSEHIHKFQSGPIRRKMDKIVNLPSASRTAFNLPSDSKTRMPSRVSVKSKSVKSKSQVGDSNLSDYLKSTSKLSPSVSPASSISEWSTESSSSTITVNPKHIGLTPCSSFSKDVMDRSSQNLHHHSSNRGLGGRDNERVGLLSQSAKQPSTGSAMSFSRPVSAKPSGLRMPSAKIGFFDGVKTGTKTPSGTSRSRSAIPSNLSRSVAGNCNASGTASKTKLGNINIAAKVIPTVAGTATPEPCRTDANVKPTVHLEDQSTGLQKFSSTENVDDVSNTSYKLPESVSPNSPVGRNDKEVFDDEKHVADSGSGTRKNSNFSSLKKEAGPERKLNSTTDLATAGAEDVFNIVDITDSTLNLSARPSCKGGQRNRSDSINVDNLDPSQEWGDADRKFASTHACQDGCESVGHGASGNQESGNKTMEIKESACAEYQAGGQDKHKEDTNHMTELQIDKDGDFQCQNVLSYEDISCSSILSCPKLLCDKFKKNEESEQFANVIPYSLPLACSQTSPRTRIPLIVKNSVSDMIETCNSSSVPAVEASVKVEALPSLEQAQKENS